MIRIFLNSPAGGTGCTTFSANLAYMFSRIGRNVLLTGTDGNTIGLHFEGLNPGQPAVSGSRSSAGDIRKITDNLQLRIVGDATGNPPLHAVRSRSNGSPGRDRSFDFDVQIFDRIEVSAEQRLEGSDWTLLVANSTANCYRQLARYQESFYSDQSPGQPGRVLTILNQHAPESSLSSDILDLMSNSLDGELYSGIFLFDELIRESAASGLPLVEYAPFSGNQPLFEQLANHVLAEHDNRHAAA